MRKKQKNTLVAILVGAILIAAIYLLLTGGGLSTIQETISKNNIPDSCLNEQTYNEAFCKPYIDALLNGLPDSIEGGVE